jgi:calcium channel MID1
MQFSCPQPGVIGFNESYGILSKSNADENGRITDMTCNYPGKVDYVAAGGRIAPSFVLLLALGALGVMMS